MEVNRENQPHILETETRVIERYVGSVEVIDIHQVNILQRMKHMQ